MQKQNDDSVTTPTGIIPTQTGALHSPVISFVKPFGHQMHNKLRSVVAYILLEKYYNEKDEHTK